MNKQLSKDVQNIRNLILSFSVAKLEVEINRKKAIKTFNVSDKTLVLSSSRMILDKFLFSSIDNDYSKIEEVNDNFFMCISLDTFMKNKLCFKKIIIAYREESELFLKQSHELMITNESAIANFDPELKVKVVRKPM